MRDALGEGISWLLDLITRLQAEGPQKPAPEKKVKKRRAGPRTGCAIHPEELARLPDAIRSHRGLSYYLYAMRVGPRRKVVRPRALDFQIAPPVSSICSK